MQLSRVEVTLSSLPSPMVTVPATSVAWSSFTLTVSLLPLPMVIVAPGCPAKDAVFCALTVSSLPLPMVTTTEMLFCTLAVSPVPLPTVTKTLRVNRVTVTIADGKAVENAVLIGVHRVIVAVAQRFLESQFAEIAEKEPELLARHSTEAGLIQKAAALWGKAGQRSLARAALVEAAEQLTRALSQIAALPATPALRREQIKLQVALISPLIHVKGYAAPETKAATEQAGLLIEQAEALGEPPDDPLLLFSVLYSFWVANYVAFNGDAMRELASHFLAQAEKQGAAVPLMVGHRVMGISWLCTGDIAQSRAHFDRAIRLYDPAEHRPLAARFSVDTAVSVLSYRSLALWLLGYPEAALTNSDQALSNAREIGQAATLMYALAYAPFTHTFCVNYTAVNAPVDELIASADEKGSFYWRSVGVWHRGHLLAMTGAASDAVQMITAGTTAYRSTGSTNWTPLFLSYLTRAYA